MASLLRKMFDTMPLKGAELGLSKLLKISISPETTTLGQLERSVKVHRKPPVLTVDNLSPSEGDTADAASIWGWRASGDPSRVEQVTCRVRDANFGKYLVLESLEWGYAPLNDPKVFRREVLVVFNGKPLVLPLRQEYHLVSFTTANGYLPANDGAELWPLESVHDQSLVHVFVYDLDRANGAIYALTNPQHPDAQEVEAMLKRCDELGKAAEDDTRNAHAVLFKDDLWDPTPSKTPPTGTVPEDVDLSLKAVRVLVACSLTVCRERNDFQPGRPASVGRLYPHVLVVATSALDRVEAGIHLKRPAQTTMLDASAHEGHHAHSTHDEMLPDIRSLLSTDSNANGMVLWNAGRPVAKWQWPPVERVPLPVWANLFNYYVPDPLLDPNVGDKLIPVVARSKRLSRDDIGAVNRDCSDIFMKENHDPATGQTNQTRVAKRDRQGQFDNIHIAPRMAVKDTITEVLLRYGPVHDPLRAVPFKSYKDWKMDEVVMAPFCVHDCFHMHWRWSDNANDEKATWGFGPVKPHVEAGRVMVPENQDVFLQLLGHGEVSYLAQAHDVPKDAWQPFCHHGAGYALHASGDLVTAKTVAATGGDLMTFKNGNRQDDIVGGDWALYYWRLRYRLVPVQKTGADGKTYWDAVLEERFSFTNEPRALGL